MVLIGTTVSGQVPKKRSLITLKLILHEKWSLSLKEPMTSATVMFF